MHIHSLVLRMPSVSSTRFKYDQCMFEQVTVVRCVLCVLQAASGVHAIELNGGKQTAAVRF